MKRGMNVMPLEDIPISYLLIPAAPQLHILEIPVSNPDLETGYPD
jgi:hypothetical protein